MDFVWKDFIKIEEQIVCTSNNNNKQKIRTNKISSFGKVERAWAAGIRIWKGIGGHAQQASGKTTTKYCYQN